MPLDLRTRIVSTDDRGEGTRQTIAQRINVTLGMVKSSSSNAVKSAISSLSINVLDAGVATKRRGVDAGETR